MNRSGTAMGCNWGYLATKRSMSSRQYRSNVIGWRLGLESVAPGARHCLQFFGLMIRAMTQAVQ